MLLYYYLISLFPLEVRCDTLVECILRLVSNRNAYTSVSSSHHILENIFKVADTIFMIEKICSPCAIRCVNQR